jgi:hypothetical protein
MSICIPYTNTHIYIHLQKHNGFLSAFSCAASQEAAAFTGYHSDIDRSSLTWMINAARPGDEPRDCLRSIPHWRNGGFTTKNGEQWWSNYGKWWFNYEKW